MMSRPNLLLERSISGITISCRSYGDRIRCITNLHVTTVMRGTVTAKFLNFYASFVAVFVDISVASAL